MPPRGIAPAVFLVWAGPILGREVSDKAAAALPQDDVCADRSSCGLSALQVNHQRQRHRWEIEEDAVAEKMGFTPTGLATNRSDRWALSEAEFEDLMVAPDWFNGTNMTEQAVQDFWTNFGEMQTSMAVELPFCQTWTAYFWPQMAFWTREISRRMDTLSMDDKEGMEKIYHFIHQASLLTSIMKMDPRKGAPWEKEVAPFFREVAAQPSTNLTMPQIPDFMRTTSNQVEEWGMEVNMWWFENLYCDLDWWRKEMLGSVVIPDGEVCWDKVEFPGVAYSLFRSIEKDLPPWPADFDPYHYPEYKQCQEFGLSKTFYDGLCPFGGHIQSGVNDVSWGQGIPSAEGRKEVLKCQKKMGPLQYSKLWMAGVKYTTDPEFGWGGFIDDGPPQLNGEDDFDFDPEVLRRTLAELWDTSYLKKMRAQAGGEAFATMNPFESPLAYPFLQAVKDRVDNGEKYNVAIAEVGVFALGNAVRSVEGAMTPLVTGALEQVGTLARQIQTMAPLLPIIEPMINKAVEAAAPGMSPIVDGVINEAVEISGPLAKALPK